MIWAIEKVSGNPKVRFINRGDLLYGPGVAAFYYPSNNTMYINTPKIDSPGVALSDFVAEASHALQFHENPVHYFVIICRDKLTVFIKALIETAGSFEDIYDKHERDVYTTKGTIENEAHFTIEPRLKVYVERL